MTRILASSLLFATAAFAADISGNWDVTAKGEFDTSYARVDLRWKANKVSGNLNELKLEGKIDGDKVTFTATRPNGNAFGTFEGVVRGDEMTGTALWRKTDKVEWTAKRPQKLRQVLARTISSRRNFIAYFPMRFRQCFMFFWRYGADMDGRCRRHRSERCAAVRRRESRDGSFLYRRRVSR